MTCGARYCPYCGRTVTAPSDDADDSQGECCGELHSILCGDEGRQCPECEEKDKERWAAYFGIKPGMTKAERRAQVEAFRPAPPEGSPEWDEWRKLK